MTLAITTLQKSLKEACDERNKALEALKPFADCMENIDGMIVHIEGHPDPSWADYIKAYRIYNKRYN